MPVAVWEVMRTLRRKDFVVSTLLLPVLMMGTFFVIAWLRQRESRQVTRIAVVRLDAPGGDNVAGHAGEPLPPLKGFAWVVPEPAERTVESLRRWVQERKVGGALVIPADFANGGKVQVIVRRESPGWRSKVARHLLEQARLARAASRGLGAQDLERFDEPVAMEEQVTHPSGRSSRGDRIAAASLVMLLITALFITNSYLAIGISGEKQARVTEVVVSAIRPQSWMDGKIAAYTAIGLAQAAAWGASVVGVVVIFGRTLPPAVNPGALAVFVLFMALGFLFYTSLYALVMATIKDLQSTSKFQAYLIFLPVAPLFFIESMIDNPDAAWAVALSLVPFFSPIMVPARLALGGAAAWEVAAALALLVVAVHLMRLAAGHAFRIGMLMYGKELSLPELMRWAKEA
jgi:ABC-2 type transport system permease protein